MNKRFMLLLAGTITALVAALLLVNLARASAVTMLATTEPSNQAEEPPNQPEIGNSRRISIPYGIASPLPLLSGRNEVVVSGHGGCPAGESVTIVISITQPATGASATGQTETDCTGAEERYVLIAMGTTSTPLVPGPAEACGVATMRLDGAITEVEDWCRAEPALLVEHHEFINLPLVLLKAAD